MQVLIVLVLALAACTQALNPGIAFPEELRSRADGRIVDGFPAYNGQFPHQGFILVTASSGSRSACGASLISTRWVLTAGHCISGFVSATVHFGDISYNDSPVIQTTTNLVLHPSYSILGLRNDIGLIGLNEDVPLSNLVQTIALPTNTDVTYSGSGATVSGFGLTVDGGAVSPTLNYAPVNVISNLVCLLSFPLNVRETVLCATGVDSTAQGTCNGDSGGPLVLVEDGVLKQIGVVSFGSASGCSASSPKGYVRPYHYLPWITEVTGITF